MGDTKANGNKSKITSLKESTPEYKQVSKLIADNWKHKLPPDSDMQNPNSHRNGGQLDYEILGIYRVDKFASENDFNKIVQSRDKYKNTTAIGKNCQKDIFFHGTSYKKTGLIMGHSGEFRVPKEEEVDHGNMLGSGIFLADAPSKSAGYLSVIEKPSDGDTGTIMVCEASLGKCFWNDHLDYTEIPPSVFKEYDSIGVEANKFTGVKNREYAIFNSKAIVPKYLVELKLK